MGGKGWVEKRGFVREKNEEIDFSYVKEFETVFLERLKMNKMNYKRLIELGVELHVS